MPHGITQCYLPPGRGDTPTLTPTLGLHPAVSVARIESPRYGGPSLLRTTIKFLRRPSPLSLFPHQN